MLKGKSERTRPLGRTIRTWENNVKTDFREIHIAFVDMYCIGLAHERKQWRALEDGIDTWGSTKCLEILE
jgi:hypothetical protein